MKNIDELSNLAILRPIDVIDVIETWLNDD